ncbi:MAG: hypothetical protein GY765_36045, partial [bacterium]|nr:hypothetical protein [bacterium]
MTHKKITNCYMGRAAKVRSLFLFLLVCILALGLVYCGGDTSPAPKADKTPAAEAADEEYAEYEEEPESADGGDYEDDDAGYEDSGTVDDSDDT